MPQSLVFLRPNHVDSVTTAIFEFYIALAGSTDFTSANASSRWLPCHRWAYHAGTLLLRHNDMNCVRLERVSSNRAGQLRTTCLILIWKDKTLQFFREFPVEDKPTLLKMERKGAKLIAAFSQDEGDTWTAFPEQPFEDFPEKLVVGVSLTSNTEKGCEVQFRNFVLEKASE